MYDREFFKEEAEVAGRSAEIVIPWLVEELSPEAVIDIGCGAGAWLAVAKAYGCAVYGVDGHVPHDMLLIEPTEFARVDLEEGFGCHGWNVALCLEVVEHLAEDAGPRLVRGLSKAGAVLFSAATPGQPGVGHINCQPHDYWHGLFVDHDKWPTFVGDRFDEPVADFYRRNMFLYQ